MTIRKQILIIGALALGMQHGMQAYDARFCKYETTKILHFVQALRQDYPEALSLAQYLEEQVCDASDEISDSDIAKIANIITTNLTTDKKIELLTTLINQKYERECQIQRAEGMRGLACLFFTFLVFGCISSKAQTIPTTPILPILPINKPTHDFDSHLNWLP